MEGLVLVLGEFLLLLFGALAIALGQIVLFVIGGIIELAIFLATGSWKSRGKTETSDARAEAFVRLKPALKILVKVLGGLTAIVVVLAWLLNTIWFEPSFRWLAGQVEQRSGIALSFDEVEGSYLSGQISLTGIKVKRADDDRLNFDASVESLSVHLNPFRLLSQPVKIQTLAIDGVDGSVQRYQPAVEPRKQVNADISIEFNLKPRRSFEIENLNVSNVRFHVLDQLGSDDRLESDLLLESLESAPFRGNYAVFDILFRSSAAGSISGAPFELQTSRVDGGRSTTWQIEQLPIAIPRHFVGGVFRHITDGTLDVDVVDRWSLGEATDIDMDWLITFRNVKAELPEGLSALESKVAGAAVNYVNENGEELPLAFSLTINEHDFEGSASLKATGLFKAVAEATLEALAERVGLSKEEIKEKVSSGYGKFKQFIDSKRKKSDGVE